MGIASPRAPRAISSQHVPNLGFAAGSRVRPGVCGTPRNECSCSGMRTGRCACGFGKCKWDRRAVHISAVRVHGDRAAAGSCGHCGVQHNDSMWDSPVRTIPPTVVRRPCRLHRSLLRRPHQTSRWTQSRGELMLRGARCCATSADASTPRGARWPPASRTSPPPATGCGARWTINSEIGRTINNCKTQILPPAGACALPVA